MRVFVVAAAMLDCMQRGRAIEFKSGNVPDFGVAGRKKGAYNRGFLLLDVIRTP